MSASGGRTTRSRFSSPYTPATKESPQESVETGKSVDVKSKRSEEDEAAGWQEPPIPQPRPSFAEAGMERHGVVANMAALGTRPSSKVMKGLLKGDNLDGSLRRSRRETSVASTPAESLAARTPEPTQTPEATPALEVMDQSEPEVLPDNDKVEDTPMESQEEDVVSASRESYANLPTTPQQQPSSQRFDSRLSLPLHSPATSNNGAFPIRPLSEPYAGKPSTIVDKLTRRGYVERIQDSDYTSGPFRRLTRTVLPPTYRPEDNFEVTLERTDAVIEHAVQAALDDGRLPTAYALRTLYDEQRSHVASVKVFEAVYARYAHSEQKEEFLAQITARKREGKKDRVAEYFFYGENGDCVVPGRRSSILSPTAMSGTTSNLFSTPPFVPQQAVKYQTPYSPLPLSGPPSGSLASNEPPTTQTSVPRKTASPAPTGEDDVVEPPTKKHKANDFEAPQGEVSSEVQEESAAPSQVNGTDKSPTHGASRSGSVSSSSSLSSLNDDALNTSAFNSPAKAQKPGASETAEESPLSLRQINPELAKIMFPQATKEFISPYASKENFERIAESVSVPPAPEGRRTRQPIRVVPKAGPKTFLFSIHKPSNNNSSSNISNSTTASGPSSSNTNTPSNTNNNNKDTNISTSSPAPPPTSTTTTRARSSMAVNSSSTSTTTTTTTPAGNPPTQGVFRTKGRNNKSRAQTPPPPYDANDSTSRMRRRARDRTDRNNAASESFERHQVAHLVPEVDSDADSASTRPVKKPPLRVRLNTRTRNNNYDSEDNSSPTLLNFQPDLAPGSVATSRAGTPNPLNRVGKKGKPGSGLRIKTSPMKKKGGILAGLSRPSGERNSPSGGANGVPEDNDDYCSSCGGNGSLVCCDGCTRSFHYQCVDPPMIEEALPDDPWFCNVCQSSRQPPPPSSELTGAFGSLLVKLNEKNPSAFQLPLEIRDCFEGVKTGTEGEYEDIVAPKTRANRPTWEEQPDYFRTRDAKGNLILCYDCNSSASAPDRKIIPCSFCSNYWHLDCVPNPLAKEPGAGRQWKCPLHVDDLLSILPAVLAPAHRFRKLKGSSVIRPSIQRGTKNNGHIEVENDASADEEDTFYQHREFDKVYRLSERALKLDFLSKVKESGGRLLPLPRHKRVPTTEVMSQHSIEEQQAALNMAALASQSSFGDSTSSLINALLAQANPTTISLIAQGDGAGSQDLSVHDRQALLAMKALIDTRLANALSSSPIEAPNGDALNGDNTTTTPKIESNDEDTEMSL